MPNRYFLTLLFTALILSVFGQVTLLADLNTSSNNSSTPNGWAALDENRFVFGAADPGPGIFPANAWVSDGTA